MEQTPPVFWQKKYPSMRCLAWYLAMAAPLPLWLTIAILQGKAPDFLWPAQAPFTCLLLVLVYPLLEELVFRGLIQDALIRKAPCQTSYMGITVANVCTSMLFAAAHLYAHPALMAALVFVPSLIFGYFRDRFHGWLLPSIILHIYYNLGYFLIFKPV